MSSTDYYVEIKYLLSGISLWLNDLPVFGKALAILFSIGIASKLGIEVQIVIIILFWNVLGALWGLLALGFCIINLAFLIIIASLFNDE